VRHRSTERRTLRRLSVWLVGLGLISILGQVVLLRELLVAFFGSELIYLLAFGFLLFETALGVLAGGRCPSPSGAQVRALLFGFAALLPLLLVFVRAIRVLFGGTPGAYLPFGQQLLGMGLALLPFGVVVGLLFQRMAALYAEESGTLAAAYAVESAGGLLGGALATLFLKWGVQNLAAGLICSLAAVLIACFPRHRDGRIWLWSGASLLGVLLLAALFWSSALDRRLTSLNHPGLAATRDTPYGRVSVTQSFGQLSVFANDGLAFESQGTAAEEFAHLAALQVESPRFVLVLGGGAEGLVCEVLKHRPERVDDVELDEELLGLLSSFLPEEIRASLRRSAVKVEIGDPRRFLANSARYDLILVGMGEPDSGQANRFYTREFFEECRAHLAPGGALAFRLRAAENLWTPALVRRTASIHRALRSVFADALVLPGTTNIVLASDAPLVRDPEVLAARWRERRIEARLVTPAYIRYLLTNDRLQEIAERLGKARAPENTDARPICYQYTLILWLSRFFPVLGLLDLPGFGDEDPGNLRAFWFLVPAAGWFFALLVCRRLRACRRVLFVAAAGFVGMVLEGALILGYQVRQGVLFQDLGILITMFMAGLSLGALGLDRCARSEAGDLPRGTGPALVGITVAVSLLVAWVFHSGVRIGLPTTALLLLACGLLVGALFAYASLRRVESQASVISPLYAADLIGGCAGSLAGSFFLLPVLGLPGSALLVALVGLGSFLLI